MDLAEALIDEFASRKIMAEQFPMLSHHGIADTDVTVHSHFLSYLAALAHPLGYCGIVECPLILPSDSRWVKLGDVRSDVVWFDKKDNTPLVAFEFERFERGNETKLRKKIENLDIVYLRSQERLQLAVLIYWVRSGIAPQVIREVTRSYRTGFVRQGIRVPPANCPLYVFKCTWRTVASGLVVSDILRVEML